MRQRKTDHSAAPSTPRSDRPDRLLKTSEAADFLAVARSTLVGWRSSGRVRIPYVMLGSAVRYRRCDLEAFLERQRVESD